MEELGTKLFDIALVGQARIPFFIDALEKPVRIVELAALELNHPLGVLPDEEADQLAVASSTQEQLVSAAELPGVGGAPSPLALLIATAGGGTAAGAAPILPLAPQHFR